MQTMLANLVFDCSVIKDMEITSFLFHHQIIDVINIKKAKFLFALHSPTERNKGIEGGTKNLRQQYPAPGRLQSSVTEGQ